MAETEAEAGKKPGKKRGRKALSTEPMAALTLKVNAAELEQMGELAKAAGCSRSELIRRMLTFALAHISEIGSDAATDAKADAAVAAAAQAVTAGAAPQAPAAGSPAAPGASPDSAKDASQAAGAQAAPAAAGRTPVPDGRLSQLTDEQRRVYEAVQSDPGLMAIDVSDATDLSAIIVSRRIKELAALGLLKCVDDCWEPVASADAPAAAEAPAKASE